MLDCTAGSDRGAMRGVFACYLVIFICTCMFVSGWLAGYCLIDKLVSLCIL
jgi:hypothetical protein